MSFDSFSYFSYYFLICVDGAILLQRHSTGQLLEGVLTGVVLYLIIYKEIPGLINVFTTVMFIQAGKVSITTKSQNHIAWKIIN
ncbi:hypothetical protein F4809DRAFT_604498 [Biscogniauxia mediterranea]|nr:hypothetical protein F4809DRAFT_604498 [Biscogniauxia mediterranea]